MNEAFGKLFFVSVMQGSSDGDSSNSRVGGETSSSTLYWKQTDMRASYHERYLTRTSATATRMLERVPERAKAPLYRSNSSLDLDHEVDGEDKNAVGMLRREYGSHGSIDVISNNGDSFFAMLRDFREINVDQRSPGPANIAEYLRGDSLPSTIVDGGASPKLKSKLQRFWESRDRTKSKKNSEVSLFRRFRSSTKAEPNPESRCCETDLDGEERTRKKAFAHYDCQSVTANLSYAARLRSLLSRRRNTTTGASAASDGSSEDAGDSRSNDVISSCPFFRNELGGEEERLVGLTRSNSRGGIHRPRIAYGVSVLEEQRHWACPYSNNFPSVEYVDKGAEYYRLFFYKQDHENWFGIDENLGPVAISVRRQRVQEASSFLYRIIVRTSELATLRGSIPEDALPNIKAASSRGLPVREVVEFVAPEIQLQCLRLGVSGASVEDELLKLDMQGLSQRYKVGVMYCKAGQSSEEDMYNNQDGSPAFNEFLEVLGQKVRLKGFQNYKAGLDTKTDSTGLYSIYTCHENCEVMFHVSTLLPFTNNNRQQLLRKRHIGNDIVTIVFQEPGAKPFTPKHIRSHFQHVFVVVRVIDPCSENTRYCVAISRSKEVPVFGPPIPDSATFPKSQAFTDFILAKVINAENAAHRSEKFATMATRTRQEYLKDLASNHVTQQTLEPHTKFSMLPSFSSGTSKKKDVRAPKFICDNWVHGALTWQVVLEDYSTGLSVECFLAISTDSLVLIEESSRDVIFVTPCKSILGWTVQRKRIHVYYHQGESICFRPWDRVSDVINRLTHVTNGSETRELQLRRNPVGQLGFHVQQDGLVTEVEPSRLAWHAGLRPGCRLVEICKIAVATLNHDQMVDLLKTSMPVSVTVIPALLDGSPKVGCWAQTCPYSEWSAEGDYENLDYLPDQECPPPSKAAARQKPGPTTSSKYDRGLSPPRSSNSSGYGTGSSSRSLLNSLDRRIAFLFSDVPNGTLTSSSSGHSGDERWYDNMDSLLEGMRESPPPLPARHQVSSFQRAASQNCYSLSETGAESLPHRYSHYDNNPPKSEDELREMKPSWHEECVLTKSASLPLDRIRSDNHSEDSSSSISPHMTRRQDTASSASSRNQSPRLRVSNHPHRHSSSLQEDLMKLINPDLIAAEEAPPMSKSRSSGALDKAAEGIITTARPATVISNDGKNLSWEERLSPRVMSNVEPMPLPDTKEMDWPSLVDTATRAIQSNNPEKKVEGEEKYEVLSERIQQLEDALKKEQVSKEELESQIQALQSENRRLQRESQTKALQLKHVTDLFLQTQS